MLAELNYGKHSMQFENAILNTSQQQFLQEETSIAPQSPVVPTQVPAMPQRKRCDVCVTGLCDLLAVPVCQKKRSGVYNLKA
jgi:hypothetical protein